MISVYSDTELNDIATMISIDDFKDKQDIIIMNNQDFNKAQV